MLNRIDLARIDLNLLVLFDVVLAERHVGRAAARLNLSPSAVSHGLTRLRRLLEDPLFLRTPSGVAPTERAVMLAEPIADILARVTRVIAHAEPFDAKSSTRRFTIGAPDGLSAIFLPPLLAVLKHSAPGVDLGVRELLPGGSLRSGARFWDSALAALEARSMDVAVLPIAHAPQRFAARVLYEDDFVIAMRRGHTLARKLTLRKFSEAPQIVVSLSADPVSFVDEALARRQLSRRVALTVPNFMAALSTISETDLVCAAPRSLLKAYAARFDLTYVEPPAPLRRFSVRAIAPKAALADAAVSWLLDVLVDATKQFVAPAA